jgi:hypothetical protein
MKSSFHSRTPATQLTHCHLFSVIYGRCLKRLPQLLFQSKSKLLYEWRFTANQFVLASDPLRPTTRDIFQLNSCGNIPNITSSLKRRWVCLLRICLAFRQVYISHIQHVTEKSSFCTTHKSSVSTGFAEQIMPILRDNGSLVTWTVVRLTIAWDPRYIASRRTPRKTPSSIVKERVYSPVF